jgi:hypothetical protein
MWFALYLPMFCLKLLIAGGVIIDCDVFESANQSMA